MKLHNLHRKQPKAIMKKVWNTDEHVGTSRSRWHNNHVKKAKPYKWSTTGTFKGQSEGYDDHIL